MVWGTATQDAARSASSAKARLLAGAAARCVQFATDTRGNMSIMGLGAAAMMTVFGGVGIDMMYSEVQRTKLQNTLDRAVLAAANMNQSLKPENVVRQYFSAMNLEDALTSVTVDEGLSYRTVTAEAERNVSANFLRMVGVPTLHSAGSSTAQERIGNVEISMVLDVSGSMGWNNKIGNLRKAAKEFVDTVVQDPKSGLTTISIVPYNATVNLGPTLAGYYNLTNEHSYSSCVTFPDSAFTTSSIDPSAPLQRLAHFDPWSSNTNSTAISNSWCKTGNTSSIMALSSDPVALKAHISSFQAGGNTAIDLGMKWGVALLDPATRPVVTNMIADGNVPASAAGRPSAYDATGVTKVLVLMTDGANTTQYDLKPKFKSGLSGIFIDDRGDSDPSNDRFSRIVRDQPGTANDVYFWTRFDGKSWNKKYRSKPDGGANAREMTYPEVFARWGTKAFGRKFYYRTYRDGWNSYNAYRDAYYAYQATVNANAADARLSTICKAARDQNIAIFAIGFEAPARGQAAMKNCASSPANYFAVEGVEISEAFQQIARTITQLRLTQ